MKIIFDPEKEAANQVKHGVSLALAERMDWDSAVTWTDDRRDYGEVRVAGMGYVDQRLFYVVFVDRADGRRIISLRKANVREVKRYAET